MIPRSFSLNREGAYLKRGKASFVLVVAAQSLTAVIGAMALPAQLQTQSLTPVRDVPDNLVRPVPPVQPVPFSHKQHLALGLQCQDCHTNPDPGDLITFPASGKCIKCHATVAKETAAVLKLAELAHSKDPIPWTRVYILLPGVRWSHREHLATGVKCETCHGSVAQMDVMAEVTGVTAMTSCIHCHEMHTAPTACRTCHLWP